MIAQEIKDKYQLVVGLEVHAQLQTATKIFSSDTNAFGGDPNTHISVITLGHPGVMPKLNEKAVRYAVMMGLACRSQISNFQYFDRKNYFYPDLPKGYQITQDKTPICVGGELDVIYGKNQHSKVYLNRIHLEEDAGKSIHKAGETETLIDLNRAGTPLIEIVTEPVIHSADEAGAFLAEIRRIVRYLDICDGNMEEGSLRCDANVSVRLKGTKLLGKKVEVKNMNSIKNVIKAINHEAERQIFMLEGGEQIQSETRTYDPSTGDSSGMRTKEELNDYRYFPDPDLSPLELSEEWIQSVKADMSSLPSDFRKKFREEYGLGEYAANVLTDKKEVAYFFEKLCEQTTYYKSASNWVMGPIKSYVNEHQVSYEDFPINVKRIAELITLVESGKVSFTIASQQIFPELIKNQNESPSQIAERLNLFQDSDSDSIQPVVEEVLSGMPDKVKAYHKGKKGLIGLFMGEVMKKTNGKVDPKVANKLVAESLEKLK